MFNEQKEEFEDTKGAIRIRKSKRDNGQKKQDKRANKRLQNIIQKNKDRVTRPFQKPVVNSDAPDLSAIPAQL